MHLRELRGSDSAGLFRFLAAQPKEYRMDFHPFGEETESALETELQGAKTDQYWGVFKDEAEIDWLALFFLRGWDEGYVRPSFGLIVDCESSGKGIGAMCLASALAYCRLQGVPSCMLKVAHGNTSAIRLYQSFGFKEEGVCENTGHLVLNRDFQQVSVPK